MPILPPQVPSALRNTRDCGPAQIWTGEFLHYP
ncbi:hypothetical protein THIOKS12850011 [Thiocapsa sp. KS1]|nr:hypothetical protein THIOKS12850011 [Thiocapsa sp. KS1]